MDTMYEQVSKEHFMDILLEVNRRVAEEFQSKGRNKQMPSSVTMLTRKLYFRPGVYERGSLKKESNKHMQEWMQRSKGAPRWLDKCVDLWFYRLVKGKEGVREQYGIQGSGLVFPACECTNFTRKPSNLCT